MNQSCTEGIFQWQGNQLVLVPFHTKQPIYGTFYPTFYGSNYVQLNVMPIDDTKQIDVPKPKVCVTCQILAQYRDTNREIKYCTSHATPGSYQGRSHCEVVNCNKLPTFGKYDKNHLMYSSRCIDHKHDGDLSTEILKCTHCNVTYMITNGITCGTCCGLLTK